MRRNQLIQIGILAVALISGYKFLESLIAVIITLLFQFSERIDDSLSYIFQYLVFLAMYFAGFFLLIRYNKQIAAYIDKQGNSAANSAEEPIPLRIEQRGLLFIVLIALCLITLLSEIPVLIISIYNYFKKDVGGIPGRSIEDLNFKPAAIRFVFTLVILFCARSVSAWLSSQISSDQPLLETGIESNETDNSNEKT